MEHTPMHRVAAASAIGTILEWYDFALYNAMSGLGLQQDLLARHSIRWSDTLLAFSHLRCRHGGAAGLAASSAVVSRHDRPPPMLIATVTTMGATTACIGLLPSYGAVRK